MASTPFHVDDPDMVIDRQGRSSRTVWGRAHMGWAALVVGVFALVLGGAVLSDQPEGSCSGIGFGCELAGPDLALLILIFVGPAVLGVLLAGHIVIAAVHRIASRIERRQGHGADSCIEWARH
jgi:uncharacterized integral membrane protein